MNNIFKKRINVKPYEYPDLVYYINAIRHSYWLHSEYNITSDIQDFKIKISNKERKVLTRAMLAISQIEVNVKRFWSNLYNYFPKPEIDDVGITFAESEVRHKDAYSFLLEKLGLNNEFEKIYDIPAIIDRVEYLEKFLNDKDASKKDFMLSLILFSLFIEHISLFGQFLIIMSFNKQKNLFKGISNIVQATSKEEEIHGRFGISLYEIVKEEQPGLFDNDFKLKLKSLSQKALKAEIKILDWIYEKGDLKFISKKVVKNYITNRFNNSLNILGIESIQNVNKELLKQTDWFDIEILSVNETDFFNKRESSYNKNNKSITVDDIF